MCISSLQSGCVQEASVTHHLIHSSDIHLLLKKKGNFENLMPEKHSSPDHWHLYEDPGNLASKCISGILRISFLKKLSGFQEYDA